MPSPLQIVVTTSLGLERFVAEELREIGVPDPREDYGAVTFDGTWRDVWRANLRLRTANRVIVELGTWNGHDGDALHAGARNLVRKRNVVGGLEVGRLLSPERTFSIRATSSRSRVTDTRWVALRVKDGLVDGQRDRHGRRASVERDAPDLPLRLRLHKNQATLLLDTSGESLDGRGYRLETLGAPVREHLAAACVLAARWDGGGDNGAGPVYDPMCGTGTLLAEAGWWATGTPPSVLRPDESYALSRLPNFDAEAFDAIRREEIPAPAPDVRLFGADGDSRAMVVARRNLDTAGLLERVDLRVADAFRTAPPKGPGLFLANPPYGERLEADRDLGHRLGELMARLPKEHGAGWTAVILVGEEEDAALAQAIEDGLGAGPTRTHPVKTGALDARILVFET